MVSGVSLQRLAGLVGVCRALFRGPAFQHLGGNVEVGDVFALIEFVDHVRDGGLVMDVEARTPETAAQVHILPADFFEAVQRRLELRRGGRRRFGVDQDRQQAGAQRGQERTSGFGGKRVCCHEGEDGREGYGRSWAVLSCLHRALAKQRSIVPRLAGSVLLGKKIHSPTLCRVKGIRHPQCCLE
jgi:hypothetical protein